MFDELVGKRELELGQRGINITIVCEDFAGNRFSEFILLLHITNIPKISVDSELKILLLEGY